MDERAIDAGSAGRGTALVMECGSRRYPVVTLGAEGCLIEALDGAVPRGIADIFDGERHVAQCLIVLAAPEGAYLRCTFKRWTAVRAAPPRDFAG